RIKNQSKRIFQCQPSSDLGRSKLPANIFSQSIENLGSHLFPFVWAKTAIHPTVDYNFSDIVPNTAGTP
ncbi:MAG: hypothetical protein VX617_07420, partial [Pseudomonadota bacterium]|nr:hypothetical protein [Pseudomonadota bacterium]